MASPLPHRPVRRTARGLLTGVLTALLTALALGAATLATAGSASAADGYRYWNYFHLDKGAWAFSTVGAGQYQPKDGAVEGWRFGTSTTSQGVTPRADLTKVTFAAVCAAEKPAAGKKRVAVVIDYGTESDAKGSQVPEPRAACAVVDAKASGQQVLESVAQVRSGNGMTCAVDGYPVTGCGEPVKNATVPTDEPTVAFALPAGTEATGADAANTAAKSGEQASEDENSLLWPLVGVAAVVVLVGGGAVAMNRRRQGS